MPVAPTAPSRGSAVTLTALLALAGLFLGLLVAAPTTASARSADTAPPVLVDFGFTPGTVRTEATAKDVVITAKLTDETGSRAPTVEIVADQDPDEVLGFGSMSLTSGTIQNGTWKRTITIPTTATPGPWTVRLYALVDTLENSDHTTRDHPTKLNVAGTAPVLTGFDFTPKTINVESSARDVVVTADLTDDTGARAPTIVITSDSTDQSLGFGSMALVAGNERAGTWRRTVSVPTTADPGSWTVTIYALVDVLENSDNTIRHHATELTVATTSGPTEACSEAKDDAERAATLVKKFSSKLTRAKKQLKAAKKQLRQAKATGNKTKIKRAKTKVKKATSKVRSLAKKKRAAKATLAEARDRVAAHC